MSLTSPTVVITYITSWPLLHWNTTSIVPYTCTCTFFWGVLWSSFFGLNRGGNCWCKRVCVCNCVWECRCHGHFPQVCALCPAELQKLLTQALFCGSSDTAGACTYVVAEVVLGGKGLGGLGQTMSLTSWSSTRWCGPEDTTDTLVASPQSHHHPKSWPTGEQWPQQIPVPPERQATEISDMNTISLDSMFSPLRTSDGGQYTCTATVNIPQAGITYLQNSAMDSVTVSG